VSHPDAPPKTPAQLACQKFWTEQLAKDGQSVSWARTASGRYQAPFANQCQAAWDAAQRAVLEEALRIVAAQPFYPDTHTGMRQQWVKTQIAEKIRALAGAPNQEDDHATQTVRR